MQHCFSRRVSILALALLMSALSFGAAAQSSGLLYDPEPPADSAYVRVVLASAGTTVDVLVDGKPRIRTLKGGDASQYMVLTAGKHTIALYPPGKTVGGVMSTIDVVQGRAMTIAFTSLRADTVPLVFEDKANTNKLKALLSVYHLGSGTGPVDISSADGTTKVFSGIASGISKAIPVNPISIDLVAVKSGESLPQGRTSLAMVTGGTYSILVFSGEGGKWVVNSAQNKIERYTGK